MVIMQNNAVVPSKLISEEKGNVLLLTDEATSANINHITMNTID